MFITFISCLYYALRPVLFLLPAEWAHHFGMLFLQYAAFCFAKKQCPCMAPVKVMGLNFNNPVGVAAGLDKDGQYLLGLSSLGFGFIEVGTVTLRPQSGHTKPRLFRLIKDRSLLNRMGFNNAGAAALCQRLNEPRLRYYLARFQTRIGISIGLNKDTTHSSAITELSALFMQIYSVADYIVINFSSPNTVNLRDYLKQSQLLMILDALCKKRAALIATGSQYKPIVVKLSPDESLKDLEHLITTIKDIVDGVIFSNTTMKHDGSSKSVAGVSGALLRHKTKSYFAPLAQTLGATPLIACGGIDSATRAQQNLDLGAKLVQIYTGLIFSGPGLARAIVTQYRSNTKT